ncbi:hypothetical protein BDZ97DRAFT_1823187 [Flammula alnicola]|nr:hypothetical protein BDZ97DRAFT_1823187 [Flammula alnicola]
MVLHSQSKCVLPFEVFCLIIDILSLPEPDIDTLLTLTLTCRSFIQPCRRNLFRELTIAHPEGELDTTYSESFGLKNSFLVDGISDIPSYVRHLTIHINPSTFGSPDFIRLFDKFTRVQGLMICSNYRDESEFSDSVDESDEEMDLLQGCIQDWNDIPMDMQEAIVRLMQSSTLTVLQLGGIKNFPLAFILKIPNLSSLEIKYCRIVPVSSSDPDVVLFATKTPFHLHLLDINCRPRFIFPLLHSARFGTVPAFDFSSLMTLCLNIGSPRDEEYLDETLGKRPGLKTLTISCDEKPLMLHNIFKRHTECIQDLKTIQLHITSTCEHYPIRHGCLPFEALRAIASFRKLEVLELDIDISPPHSETLTNDLIKLDKLLASPKFPVLRLFSLQIGLFEFEQPAHLGQIVAWKSFSMVSLQRLAEKKDLEIDLSICEIESGE